MRIPDRLLVVERGVAAIVGGCISVIMAASTASPWCCPGRRLGRRRCGVPAAFSKNAAQHRIETIQPLQRLPPVAYSYNLSRVDAAELADLLQQVACFAPGQSFHASSSGDRGAGGGSPGAAIDSHRLRGALQRSLVCVAAYASEQHLPQWQHLGSRGLCQEQQQQPQDGVPWPTQPGWQRQQRRVLVGFARAVGDAALVATVHDVAVMPELQHLGLGRQLLGRLLRQLDVIGIVDVGLLAPKSSQGFFAACSFGRDSEGSTTMTLSGAGMSQREGLPLAGMSIHLKPAAPR